MQARLASMDDAELQWIALARGGDQRTFRLLVDAHARKVRALCLRITRDPALADDAVQETFYNVWRHLGSFDERAAFTTWLHRVAVNAALEQLRRNARHQNEVSHAWEEADGDGADYLSTLADELPGPEDHTAIAQLTEHIGAQMGALSATERAAFVLRHWEGQGLNEIAQTLSMNSGQCKQAIFRAVRKLRGALESVR